MHSVVIGASGGIGRALADLLEQRGEAVSRLSRRDTGFDLADEHSIAAAAGRYARDVRERTFPGPEQTYRTGAG